MRIFTGFCRAFGLVFLTLVAAAEVSAKALELHREPASPSDLVVVGALEGVATGEKRYVRHADLLALPTTKLRLTGEFMPGEQEVTALFLSDVWALLPKATKADCLLAACKDGYASVFKTNFMRDYRPFLVLQINGQNPDTWPVPGSKYNPGPYVITVAEAVVPAVATLLDAGHKKPWGTIQLEVANYAERFRPFYSGNWSSSSPQIQEGREIWIHSCYSCHRGPKGTDLGGTKADRPFEVLVAHAAYNRDYFKLFVRAPKEAFPGAKMEAHPHYTDAQLEALIAFLTAKPASPVSK